MNSQNVDNLIEQSEEKFAEFTSTNPANLTEQQMKEVAKLVENIIKVVRNYRLLLKGRYTKEQIEKINKMEEAALRALNESLKK